MKRQVIHIHTRIRALVRDTLRYRIATQKEHILALAKTLEHDATNLAWFDASKPGDRDRWYKAGHADDIYVVGDLDLIPDPRHKGQKGQPSTQLARIIAATRKLLVIEARTGIRSDGDDWPEACAVAAARVRTGRRLTSKEAAKIGSIGGQRSSQTRWWKEPAQKKLREEIGAIWRDVQQYPNYTEALLRINLALADRQIQPIGSDDTARDIWGGRGRRRGPRR